MSLAAPMAAAWAQDEDTAGMITIEVVENPGFFEMYGNWIYGAAIVAALAVFAWRRFRQGRA